MKIVIIGAGELGKNLASAFCNDGHDVIIVDTSYELLELIKSKLDVMTIHGNALTYEVIKEVGIDDETLFIAVTNNDITNIFACQIAGHLASPKIICRLSCEDYFSTEDNFTPEKLGINYLVIPQLETVRKIINILDNNAIIEKIEFSHEEAIMTALKILPESPLVGTEIKKFPDPKKLNRVRFSAIIRQNELIFPRGDTIFLPGDEVYIAGKKEHVSDIVKMANPNGSRATKVVIAGATPISKMLIRELCKHGYEVRLAEEDKQKCENLKEEITEGTFLIINGNPTEKDVLEEIGVNSADIFVSAMQDDANNILSCILAKKIGAQRTVSVTNKQEYLDIVSAMNGIDSSFSPWLVAVNSILRYIDSPEFQTDALLHRADAYISEFEVKKHSRICNKRIADTEFPPDTVFALVFREGEEVIAASGDLILQERDMVATITTRETLKQLRTLFSGAKPVISLFG